MFQLHKGIPCKFFEIGKIELSLMLNKIVILEFIFFQHLY